MAGSDVNMGQRVRLVERSLQDLRAKAMAEDADRLVLDDIGDMELAAQDARLFIRDYEYAESRADQLLAGTRARAEFAKVQKGVLLASQHDLLGPADVAQLSAQVQWISDQLV